jgi:large subunit ribosomal protein L21
MYAIIRTGGKQYRVAEGDTLKVERLKEATPGAKLRFTDVLLLGGAEAQPATVGQPLVEGASVLAEVTAEGRHPKVIIFKHKRRKGMRRKTGHRQPWTEVRVTGIEAG